MKQIGAVSILTTMLLGLLAWGGTQISNNKTDIARVDAIQKIHYEAHQEMLKEIRGDVKLLLQRK